MVLAGLALAVLGAVATVSLRKGEGRAPAQPVEAAEEPVPAPAFEAGTEEAPPPAPLPPPDSAAAAAAFSEAAAAVAADQEVAELLAARLRARVPVRPEDEGLAEELFARYPEAAGGLLEAVLIASAEHLSKARRFDEAVGRLRRAAAVAPRSPHPRRGLVAVRTEQQDWPGLETAARDLLALEPDDGPATRSLAYALVRQDRSREAIELLARWTDGRQDPEAAALLERLRRERQAEGGFDERRLAHFNVRYDGEAHEDVGREILRVLERHYAALRTAFDHEPPGPIPVTLFSTRSYFDATGAPSWSGGEYDHFDGRIRVPIGGLTTSLSPDLEETLLHEVAHAFITDLSGGLAPREIQEGLAQWSEGMRSEARLGADGMTALADGRIEGVTGFYLTSLILVEDLVAQRGRGGLNDLLRAMARTRSVDAAAQEVYGRPFRELQAQAASRLRQRHGS